MMFNFLFIKNKKEIPFTEVMLIRTEFLQIKENLGLYNSYELVQETDLGESLPKIFHMAYNSYSLE